MNLLTLPSRLHTERKKTKKKRGSVESQEFRLQKPTFSVICINQISSFGGETVRNISAVSSFPANLLPHEELKQTENVKLLSAELQQIP